MAAPVEGHGARHELSPSAEGADPHHPDVTAACVPGLHERRQGLIGALLSRRITRRYGLSGRHLSVISVYVLKDPYQH